jgi:hypothetical protein
VIPHLAFDKKHLVPFLASLVQYHDEGAKGSGLNTVGGYRHHSEEMTDRYTSFQLEHYADIVKAEKELF